MTIEDYYQMLELSRRKVAQTELTFSRFLLAGVDWRDRLIQIFGARGTGKTTMILQHIKADFRSNPDSALYASLDNLWFETHSLLELVDYHIKNGGTHVFLDEVQYLKDWQLVIKNLYDNYPGLHIVYTGSSLLKIDYKSGDLSRRRISYSLPGLSFREYLRFENIAIYNGIKVFTYGGRDASEEQTREIEEYVRMAEAEGQIQYVDYEEVKTRGWVVEFNPLNEYLDNIIANINMQAIRDCGLHIVLDPMYGVGQDAIKTILSTARCEIDIIHGTHDTLFGRRMPAPSKDALTELRTYVTEMECDLGIATDGDADRLGVIDDKGHYLTANDILRLLYYYLLKYKGWRGPAVRNVATTHMLDRMAEAFGEVCYEVPVGFKYISAKMQETGAIIGGESSGGLTVRGHINGKDGVYAASLLVEMIAVTGKKLSELTEEIEERFGTTYMEERSYKFTPERKAELIKLLFEDKRLPELGILAEKVSYLDGCKVYLKNGGWIIARFSGTEPLLRIFCEMPKEEEAKRYCDEFADFLML